MYDGCKLYLYKYVYMWTLQKGLSPKKMLLTFFPCSFTDVSARKNVYKSPNEFFIK